MTPAAPVTSTKLRTELNGQRDLPKSRDPNFKSTGVSSRLFSNSRALGAQHNSSTIDFAFLPNMDAAMSSNEIIRVPFLPDFSTPTRSARSHEAEASESVFRAEISLASLEATHTEAPSAMSDVVDNGAIVFDPYDLTNKVSKASRKVVNEVVEKVLPKAKEKGLLREVWSGIMDDLFRPSQPRMA